MQNEELEIIRMSEIQMREVEWLWYPYIPFGKLTIIQDDPGEGKTTFALRLAAACSTGRPMPGMESLSPFNVIYQSAEDGLEDTINPRLTEAGADQERVINIREDKRSLHLLDSRIEKAILQCDAKPLILDPLQGYLGERIDMNRANEIREVVKAIGQVAQRTGCAAVIVHADGNMFCFIIKTVVSALETTRRLPVKNINLMFFTAMGIASSATPIFFFAKKKQKQEREDGENEWRSTTWKQKWSAEVCGDLRLPLPLI